MQEHELRSIRIARLLAGWSQAELARAIGKSQSWLSQLELGYLVPDAADLRRLIERLATALDGLDVQGPR